MESGRTPARNTDKIFLPCSLIIWLQTRLGIVASGSSRLALEDSILVERMLGTEEARTNLKRAMDRCRNNVPNE